MRLVAVAITIFSAALWGADIVNVFTEWMPGRGAEVEGGAAVMTGIVAALLWVALWARDWDLTHLIRLSADLYRRIPADDRPPLLRGCDQQQDARRAQ